VIDHHSLARAIKVSRLARDIVNHSCSIDDGCIVHDHRIWPYPFMKMMDIDKNEE